MLSYDKKINNLFIYWITITLLLIFLMIIIGGLTRLTNSGLSITEWELFKGILPPLSQSTWDIYFNEYKKIPQYELMNQNMSLEEFKVIFYWEYIHRILGRFIGLIFIIPLLYFHFKNKISKENLKIYYFVFILIIVQGVVGWYMVKSGLVNDITVSHYRLSIHLSIAIAILAILFWQYLNIKANKQKNFFNITREKFPYFFLIILLFLQIILGAFVSGLDAGKVYQTWPLMGLNYFPDDLQIENFFNLLNFESHSLVQFYHRNMAYLITLYIFLLGYFILKKNNRNLHLPLSILFGILLLQILLGVLTLISNLNILIASAHQISSVILVLSALNLYYSIIK